MSDALVGEAEATARDLERMLPNCIQPDAPNAADDAIQRAASLLRMLARELEEKREELAWKAQQLRELMSLLGGG